MSYTSGTDSVVWEEKIWGRRALLSASATHTAHYLQVKKGYRCSWHQHLKKHNKFVVLTGLVEACRETVNHRAPGRPTKTSFRIFPGETHHVGPGKFHEFRGLLDSDMIEIAWVDDGMIELDGDIERRSEGGMFELGGDMERRPGSG